MFLGDGIYDKLTNQDVIETVWSSCRENRGDNIHQACANAVEAVMKTAIAKRTVDNITVVMIAFSSFKYLLFPKRADLIGNNSLDNIAEFRNLHEIHRINNSFDYSAMTHENTEFVTSFPAKPPLKENGAKTPQNANISLTAAKPNATAHNPTAAKKKTVNGGVNNALFLARPEKKKEGSQEKKGLVKGHASINTNLGSNAGGNNPGGLYGAGIGNSVYSGGQRASVKKNENSLYSHRGTAKNPEKKK